jgi:hypothetical protein
MKSAIAAILLSSAFTTGAFAQDVAQAPSDVPVEHYHYGMNVDVAKVISITKSEVSNLDESEPATMVYQDHQGKVHALQYLESIVNENTNG